MPTNPVVPDKPVDTPASTLRILQDKETGVAVIGRPSELGAAVSLRVTKVLDQSLMETVYDAYDIRLVDQEGKEVQPKGAVLVRLPVQTGKVADQVYYVTTSKELQALNFSQTDQYVEFATSHFSIYAVVYKSANESSELNQHPVTKELTSVVRSTEQPNQADKPVSEAKELPNTGDSSNRNLIFLASLSLALSSVFYLKTKKR
ncbi:Endo-beta-N-acetylglucosaminidase [Streptococcus sp. DD10]|nr:Endo-beta-N-acetylglucosaminidase [Streptococcus sp. DD10]